MLTDWARRAFRWALEPIARLLQRTGVSPNLISLIGFFLQVTVALILANGWLQLGGVLLALFSAFDGIDGALARVSGQVSRFGAFLDATIDRYAEAVVLLGLLVHVSRQGNAEQVLLIYATIVGSLIVSYTRAKAESLELSCKVGILTRAERVGVLVLGLVLNRWQPLLWLPDMLTLTLWFMALLSNFTALQRIWFVWKITAAERMDKGAGMS